MGSLPSINSEVEGKEEVVPVGFDEGVLRGLCEMDVGDLSSFDVSKTAESGRQCALPLLADRIKQSIVSCKVGLFC